MSPAELADFQGLYDLWHREANEHIRRANRNGPDHISCLSAAGILRSCADRVAALTPGIVRISAGIREELL